MYGVDINNSYTKFYTVFIITSSTTQLNLPFAYEPAGGS
jgi:hypothetical protein